MSEKDLGKRIKLLEKQMLEHAKSLEFEKAARVRDQLALLREQAFGAAPHDVNIVPAARADPQCVTRGGVGAVVGIRSVGGRVFFAPGGIRLGYAGAENRATAELIGTQGACRRAVRARSLATRARAARRAG
jgi:hypothetical protein